MRLLFRSATYTLPAGSTAMSEGCSNWPSPAPELPQILTTVSAAFAPSLSASARPAATSAESTRSDLRLIGRRRATGQCHRTPAGGRAGTRAWFRYARLRAELLPVGRRGGGAAQGVRAPRSDSRRTCEASSSGRFRRPLLAAAISFE